MLYGITANGKERAAPGMSAICPECGEQLIPKCGEINIWHWAHRPGSDCDYDPGEMCAWHIEWQEYFDAEHSEVWNKVHRLSADAIAHDGTVIEFQHSSINTETIQKREAGHGKVVWVFDATELSKDRLTHCKSHIGGAYLRWSRPRKTWASVGSRSIYDMGNNRLWVVQEYVQQERLCVYGYWITKSAFITWAKTGVKAWDKPQWASATFSERQDAWLEKMRAERLERERLWIIEDNQRKSKEAIQRQERVKKHIELAQDLQRQARIEKRIPDRPYSERTDRIHSLIDDAYAPRKGGGIQKNPDDYFWCAVCRVWHLKSGAGSPVNYSYAELLAAKRKRMEQK